MLSEVDNEQILPLVIIDNSNKDDKEEISKEDWDTIDLEKNIKNIAKIRDLSPKNVDSMKSRHGKQKKKRNKREGYKKAGQALSRVTKVTTDKASQS